LSVSDEEIHQLVRAEASDCLQRMEANLLALESGEGGAEQLDAVLRDAHSIKGSSAMIGWQEPADLADAIEERMERGRQAGAVPIGLIDLLLRVLDGLRSAVSGERGVAAPLLEELAAFDVDREPAAVEAKAPTRAGGRDTEQREGSRGTTAGRTPTVRVDAAKVDHMLEAVGETVLHHRRLEHALEGAGREGRRVSEELDLGERLLGDLQDSVVQMRTLPLSTITSPFPRAVRDLASEHGKEASLEISGADTQLDRAILDGISETIVHLLRNAVAHGIEAPEERESAGKPSVGRIELRAHQRGGMVAIEVADDGRGVTPELLAGAEEAGSLADLLATTGFSTAGEVTQVAGRGVGLDAVKRNVEGLGGGLEVRSEPGSGTEVTLLLPLTLALMRVLLFERGGQAFALPMTSVDRVVAVTETTSLGKHPSIDIDGQPVPLSWFGSPGAAAPPPPRAPAIVVDSLGRRLAVVCDELIGEQEVVTKSLGAMLAGVGGYLGAAILGDGRIALVLDPNHLLNAPREAMALDGTGETTARAPATVLVVDDQLSARELQRSILEVAGYRVEVARDGREALRRIRETADLDLVLTDVQMPEMDGFELLQAIRADDVHGSLPVVVVTTLGDEASRRRGAEAGADAYVVKNEFDQEALLETIERLVGE
jgi:two-component system, chemotaxis family, sensor kinase CheA